MSETWEGISYPIKAFDTEQKAVDYCEEANENSNAKFDDYGIIEGSRCVYTKMIVE